MAVSSSDKQVMIVAIDDSEHSTYALEWTLDRFFANPIFKFVLIHARPTATSTIGFVVPGTTEMLPNIDSDLRNIATRVVDSAKQLCINKSVDDVLVEVVEGDPRNVLCDAVERHRASMLVVGSHGYGAIKRAVLGSVSDYCAHHANCTVMIVKKPKIKN